jgi:hypothetical protein
MKTIHKFRLEGGKAINTLKLREGYRAVRCEYVVPDKCVYLWVEQPLSVDIATVVRQFIVTFSGDPVPIHYSYVDTAIDTLGAEAYHVFEVSGPATGEMLTRGEVHSEPLAAKR